MDRGLIANANSEYYHSEAKLRGIDHFAQVLVEDESDISFWSRILKECEPSYHFEITPYSYLSNGAKGKSHIIEAARQGRLGPYFIGCVDSDTDYLLPDSSDEARTLQNCHFLIQTYSYSIENLMCCPKGLQQVCIDASSQSCAFDFAKVTTRLSQICYPLLIRWLFLKSTGRDDIFTSKQWGNIMNCADTLQNCDCETLLHHIFENVATACRKIDPALPKGFETFAQHLKDDFGVVPETAILYVRGHDLFKFILKALIEPLSKQAKSDHINHLKSMTTNDEERKNKLRHYMQLTHIDQCDLLLRQNFSFWEYYSEISSRIANDISLTQKVGSINCKK